VRARTSSGRERSSPWGGTMGAMSRVGERTCAGRSATWRLRLWCVRAPRSGGGPSAPPPVRRSRAHVGSEPDGQGRHDHIAHGPLAQPGEVKTGARVDRGVQQARRRGDGRRQARGRLCDKPGRRQRRGRLRSRWSTTAWWARSKTWTFNNPAVWSTSSRRRLPRIGSVAPTFGVGRASRSDSRPRDRGVLRYRVGFTQDGDTKICLHARRCPPVRSSRASSPRR